MANNNQYKSFKFNISKKKKKKERFLGIKKFFYDVRIHKTLGLFLILISIYLFIAFTSYLFSWKYDQSIIDGQSLKFIFNNEGTEVKNWLGKFGAFVSHRFLKLWYGISSYVFSLIAFIIGFRALFKHSLLPIVKSLKVSFFSLLWFCLFFGFVFRNTDLDFMGGLYGLIINNWLIGVLGTIGTGFFIVFSGFSLIIILFNPSFSWIVNFSNRILSKIKTIQVENNEKEINVVNNISVEN